MKPYQRLLAATIATLATIGAATPSFEQAPSSTGVSITRAFVDWIDTSYACVWFQTADSVKVTDAEFAFAWDGYQPGHLDRQFWSLGVYGPFPPQANYYPDATIGGSKDCLGGGGGANMDVVLTGARYGDGSTWHAVPTLTESTSNDAQSPIDITSATVYAGAQPISWNLSQGSYGQGVPTFECVDLTNTSSKPVTHVQIGFSHLGSNGASLGSSDPLDLRATIAPGASLRTNCRPFRGTISPNEFSYGKLAAEGIPSSAVPQLLFGGVTSTVNAQVNEVDFADRTAWHAAQ